MFSIRKNHLHLVAMLTNRLLLWRHREPVEVLGSRTCAITLHRHLIAMLMKEVHESLVNLQCGFTACQDDKEPTPCPSPREGRLVRWYKSLDSIKNLLVAHLAIGLELRIAERTAQVAACETYEYRCTSRVTSLTLQRIENIVYAKSPHGGSKFFTFHSSHSYIAIFPSLSCTIAL